MNRGRASELVANTLGELESDPSSDVVWAGKHDGRLGARMAQRCRDFTTVWFEVGERTVGVEAFLLPSPPYGRAEVYRQCLLRNMATWPAALALDRHGDICIVGRIPLAILSRDSLDTMIGAVYQTVELAFRPLLEAGFAGREKTR